MTISRPKESRRACRRSESLIEANGSIGGIGEGLKRGYRKRTTMGTVGRSRIQGSEYADIDTWCHVANGRVICDETRRYAFPKVKRLGG